MLEVVILAFRAVFASLRPRRDLVLENLAQLHVTLRTNQRPLIRDRDLLLWVWLRRLWPGRWRQHLAIVRLETVLSWQRKGWRLF